MTALLLILAFVVVSVALGVYAALDLRPQQRPPEWSVGHLMAPRH